MAETDHIRFADKHIRNCAQSFALQTIAFTLNMFALSMDAGGKRPEIACRHPCYIGSARRYFGQQTNVEIR